MHSDFIIFRHSAHPLVAAAYIDCQKLHEGQTRKYDGSPYWLHPREVVEILIRCGIEDPDMLCAAFGHDWYEDTEVTEQHVRNIYGDRVHNLITGMTKVVVGGDRRSRALAEAYRLNKCDGDVQTIKCADLISNTRDIVEGDPKFAAIYLPEKRYVLDNLPKADPVVRAWAYRSLEAAETALSLV